MEPGQNIYDVIEKIKSTKQEIEFYKKSIERCQKEVTMLMELYRKMKPSCPVISPSDNDINIRGFVSEGSCRLVKICEPERPPKRFLCFQLSSRSVRM
jgi:hypothetical protein